MKIITRGRGGGKTVELIKLADGHNGYIVCHDNNECTRVFWEAKRLGFNINFPISNDEFINRDYHAPGVKKLFIDNADWLFREWVQRYAPIPIVALTMSDWENLGVGEIDDPVRLG